MNKVLACITKKPPILIIIPLLYLVITVFLKWQITPTVDTIWFIIGGVIGIFLLDVAEVFFKLVPSPFRTIVFAAGFLVVSLFIITSSGSPAAIGLTLSIYLSMILWQVGAWQVRGNLNDWFHLTTGEVSVAWQRILFAIFVLLFVAETILFLWPRS